MNSVEYSSDARRPNPRLPKTRSVTLQGKNVGLTEIHHSSSIYNLFVAIKVIMSEEFLRKRLLFFFYCINSSTSILTLVYQAYERKILSNLEAIKKCFS